MTNWLGIDHGEKRIGLAIGNTDDRIACPLGVIPADEKAVSRILEFARDYDATSIVVGWPLNMDSTEGSQADEASNFAKSIAAAGDIDVRLWDERLSSFEADQSMDENMTRDKRRSRRDAVAASVFLEDFLNNNGPELAPSPGEK
jgi:putative Holliday junction resolvase